MIKLSVRASRNEEKVLALGLLQDALRREKSIMEYSLSRTASFLQEFEQKYDSASDEFFKRYRNGEMDDRNDFIDWAGEYQIYSRLREKLDCLEELSL